MTKPPSGVGIALAAILACAAGARAGSDDADLAGPTGPVSTPGIALEVDTPLPDEQLRQLAPWVEVSGRAGRAPFFASDVVLLLDQGGASLLASGSDIDGDGEVGRNRGWAEERGRFAKRPRDWTSDVEDTVFAAERAIADAVAGGLEARGNQVGLITYADLYWIRAPVGPPVAARAALRALSLPERSADTDLARALDAAGQLLSTANPVEGAPRPRSVLLFGASTPTLPDGAHWSRRRAVDRARELGAHGIRVWTVAFPDADHDYLAELARASGGAALAFDDLQQLSSEPGPAHLAPQRLSIVNTTTGEAARAVRLFPDGRFDAFVPLVPGPNDVVVSGVLADGSEATVRRRIDYATPETETEADRRDAARVLLDLRRRTKALANAE